MSTPRHRVGGGLSPPSGLWRVSLCALHACLIVGVAKHTLSLSLPRFLLPSLLLSLWLSFLLSLFLSFLFSPPLCFFSSPSLSLPCSYLSLSHGFSPSFSRLVSLSLFLSFSSLSLSRIKRIVPARPSLYSTLCSENLTASSSSISSSAYFHLFYLNACTLSMTHLHVCVGGG